jgi:DNA-binding transcriptional ArsR family regulator
MRPESLIARLKALGEPNRLAIIHHLESRSCSATELLRALPDLSQPSLSRHVHILRDAGLLVETRRGRIREYRLAADPTLARVLPMIEWPASPREADAASPSEGREKRFNTSTFNDVMLESEDHAPPGGDFQEWLT